MLEFPVTPAVNENLARFGMMLGVKAVGRKPGIDEILRAEPRGRVSALLAELRRCPRLLCPPSQKALHKGGWSPLLLILYALLPLST